MPPNTLAEVREKALPSDLAVVHDIEPHFNLSQDDLPSGRTSDVAKGTRFYWLSPGTGRVKRGELSGSGQAPGMGGQNAAVAPLHGLWSLVREWTARA